MTASSSKVQLVSLVGASHVSQPECHDVSTCLQAKPAPQALYWPVLRLFQLVPRIHRKQPVEQANEQAGAAHCARGGWRRREGSVSWPFLVPAGMGCSGKKEPAAVRTGNEGHTPALHAPRVGVPHVGCKQRSCAAAVVQADVRLGGRTGATQVGAGSRGKTHFAHPHRLDPHSFNPHLT